MYKSLFLLTFVISVSQLNAQDTLNFSVKKIRVRGEKKELSLQQSLEYALTLQPYFKIVEREDIARVIEAYQEEVNLAKDFGRRRVEEIKFPIVDYIVEGDLDENYVDKGFTITITFTKISGKDASKKLPLSFKLGQFDVFDKEKMNELFAKKIDSFSRMHFYSSQKNSKSNNESELESRLKSLELYQQKQKAESDSLLAYMMSPLQYQLQLTFDDGGNGYYHIKNIGRTPFSYRFFLVTEDRRIGPADNVIRFTDPTLNPGSETIVKLSNIHNQTFSKDSVFKIRFVGHARSVYYKDFPYKELIKGEDRLLYVNRNKNIVREIKE